MDTSNKKWMQITIIITVTITLITILTMLQNKKLITPGEKQEIEDVAKEMVEIELTYKDGKYVVDNAQKAIYIDVT